MGFQGNNIPFRAGMFTSIGETLKTNIMMVKRINFTCTFHGSNAKRQSVNGSLSEPGYYKDNDFGIRIEDVAVVVPAQTKADEFNDNM